MRMRQFFLVVVAILVSTAALSKEIIIGVEPIKQKKIAMLFTPIVLPDLLSAKAAFEYRLHKKFNLVVPVEAKWMDYRRAIKFAVSAFGGQDTTIPESLYAPDQSLKIGWNIDFFQFKLSSGLGVKYFPFSESMTNAFFLKTLFMAGYERFNAYSAEGRKESAVLTHVVTIGYNWVKLNRFTFGFEVGEEYTWHTNPIKNIPMLISGFMPLFHLSLGFTI